MRRLNKAVRHQPRMLTREEQDALRQDLKDMLELLRKLRAEEVTSI